MHHPAMPITPPPDPSSRQRPGACARGGFTIVELLIVMAIMAVLGAMAFLGFRAMIGQGQNNRTRVALSNAASILAEYEVKTGLKRQPPHVWKGAAPAGVFQAPPYTDTDFSFWRDADPDTDDNQGLQAPRSVEPEEQARTDSAAVRNTQLVLFLAAQVPSNKTLIGNLGSDQTMRLENVPASGSYDESTVPVLLDAWGNPIIFVPASGLRGVYLGDPAAEFVITSVRVYAATGTGALTDGHVAPNARPFFASAGPDGYFSFRDLNLDGDFDAGETAAGDDNLYSFER